MNVQKLFLLSCFLNMAAYAMEGQEQDKLKAGIFLHEIVSQYKNPVSITRMPLRHDYNGDSWVDADLARARCFNDCPLAVVWEAKSQIYTPELETHIKATPSRDDKEAIIRELVVLRLRDIVTGTRLTDIFLRKYLKYSEAQGKRGHVYVNGEIIEKFPFDYNKMSNTRVTLKLDEMVNPVKGVTVSSVTTPLEETYQIVPPGLIP